MTKKEDMITPLKEQSKRSAAEIFAVFEYQWDCFVLMLLKENDDTVTVSFEIRDDVDVQYEDNTILYQIKHSVQKNARGETINLSNRDADLWKTISTWMKFIDEDSDVLEKSSFILVTNKNISKNKFVKALESFARDNNVDNLKATLITVRDDERTKLENSTDTAKKKGVDISKVINELLGKNYLYEFCNRISVSKTSDLLKEDIKRLMSNRFGLNRNRVDWVYSQLMTKLKDDSIENIVKGLPVSYTGAIFTKRYQSILDIGRQKIHFRTDYSFQEFSGEPRDLLFMKQLFSIGDTKEDELDRIVELTTRWLCFNNNLHEHWNNEVLTSDDVDKLTKNVFSTWDNCYRSKHRKITSKSTDDELCEAGCDTVSEMRNKNFSLANNPLEEFLSEGCIYYYSNTATDIIPELPIIGWHHDWKLKFKNPNE